MPALKTYRPGKGRTMALTAASVGLVIFGAVAVLMPNWHLGDRLLMFSLGVGLALVMWRYATIRADVLDEGVRVRNLMLTETIAWREIAELQFVEGDPWPQLVLQDTDTRAVMAIQRSDGPQSVTDAQELASFIERHQ